MWTISSPMKSNHRKMQYMFEAFNHHAPAVGMCINALMIKVMSAPIVGEQCQAILLNGDDVNKFKYLCSMFISIRKGIKAIRGRINLARYAFKHLRFCFFIAE